MLVIVTLPGFFIYLLLKAGLPMRLLGSSQIDALKVHANYVELILKRLRE